MTKDSIKFDDYLEELKKDDLNAIVDNYNKLAAIYKDKTIGIKGLKKEDIVELIIKNKTNYVRYVLSIISKEECEKLLDNNYPKNLQDYLQKYQLLDEEKVLYRDIKKIVEKLLKEEDFVKKLKEWDNINTIVNGLIIAYGVVDTDYVKDILSKYGDIEQIFSLLKLGIHNYSIEKKKMVSKLLTSRKRIDKYYSDNNLKEFSIKELQSLGNNKYHYNIKEYKKLISTLKNYYVFKKNDINFIDENIIIPYLYTSINEEKNAKNVLMSSLQEHFEFRKDRLQEKICQLVDGIRNNFPLWEYRGHSKKEVGK